MARHFPHALVGGVLSCLPACAEAPSACADAVRAFHAAQREADDRPPVDHIVIPMQPLTERPLVGVAEFIESGPAPRLRLDAWLTLAVGDGYPTAFTASVPQPLWTACGPLEGTVTLHDLSGGSEAISAVLVEAGVALTVGAVGTADLSLAGEITLTEPSCKLPAGTPIALDLSIAVRAVRPVDTIFDLPYLPYACGGDVPIVAPSMPNVGLRLQLRDEAGEPLNADNAAWDAQVTVELHGSFAAAHSEPASLAEWIAPAVPGEVQIVPVLGPPLRIDVVDPRRITETAIEFQLAGLKGPTLLEPGETYDGWTAGVNRIAPMVRGMHVDGVRVCSPPPPLWFELQTLTPEVCQVVALDPSDSESKGFRFRGETTGQAADLRRDGTCSLTLCAPQLAASGDFPLTVSATFHDVHRLHAW